MDGLEFISALKADIGGLRCAIVMLTGVKDERVAVSAMKSGATDYIPKGENIVDVLEHAITGAIDKFRLQRKHNQVYPVRNHTAAVNIGVRHLNGVREIRDFLNCRLRSVNGATQRTF
jgi:FixJ family two-component response regulator